MSALRGLLDLLRMAARSPFILLAVILVMCGLSYEFPGLFGNYASLARETIAIIAAVAGIYVIYSSLMSRSRVDDYLGTLFGLVLLCVAAYMGFGVNVISMLQRAASVFSGVVPYAIASGLGLTGIVLVSRRDKASEAVGIILVLLALAVLGVRIAELFR